MKTIVSLLLGLLLVATPAWAQASDEDVSALQQQMQQLTQLVEQLKGTVQAQQQRIAELERSATSRPTAQSPSFQASASPARTAALATQAQGSLSAFNPEIGMLADVTGQLSENGADAEGNDKLSVREVELIVGHPIDPYSRLDTTITFSDFESPTVEEAYITHWGLSGELKAKVGRMRPKIGKASAVHRDQLETVDEPLVVQKYLGAEGLFRTGVELSGFLPTPWTAVTHELTAGVMEGGIGEGGTLFGSNRRYPSLYAHLKNFWDVSDTTNIELGTTYLTGSKDADPRFEVNALGLDATLVHYVTPTNKLKWQNELYLQDRDESITQEDSVEFADNPWGFYSLADYRLSPRWGIGGRFDYVELVDVNPLKRDRHSDTAFGGHLTLYQSEFSRWRMQYRHTEFAQGSNENAVFLQGTVAIGVHKHQLQ